MICIDPQFYGKIFSLTIIAQPKFAGQVAGLCVCCCSGVGKVPLAAACTCCNAARHKAAMGRVLYIWWQHTRQPVHYLTQPMFEKWQKRKQS